MLDKTAKVNSLQPFRRICIIGSGISGLVAAKVMRERSNAVTVFEKSGDIGGVWEPARSYPGVRTQTPGSMYAYTDFPMPADYPEWPTGAQVHGYLDAYATRSELRACILFRTEVRKVSPAAGGAYSVTLRDAAGEERVETFDFVIIATGQFSVPLRLDIPGAAAFEGAGGQILHSSENVNIGAAKGRDLVVVGYSKSATDVAMNALQEGARSVTVVYREATWKIPYFFGGLVNFKNILYCRASEAMFMPWAPSIVGRIVRGLSAPMIWANWRALEALLNMQFGLKKLGLRPKTRIEDSIHCATSIETPGFYKAIKQGRIKLAKGNASSYQAGALIVDGVGAVPADVVVLAIGWKQELPFLDPSIQAKLIDADGQYKLHRMMVNPDLPGLGFVGFNSSFITTLSAEIGSNWLARYMDNELKRQPTDTDMRKGIASQLRWKRKGRPVAQTFGGLCVAPYHHFHFDELMGDIGARKKSWNVLAAHLGPIDPKIYGKLLATAPQSKIKEIA